MGHRYGEAVPVRVAPWLMRLTWVLTCAAAVVAISDALDGRSSMAVGAIGVGAWTIGGVVAVALIVPSTASLTLVRAAAPLAVVGGLATLIAGADGAASAAFLVAASINALTAASGEVGEAFVQASAYGDERRFPLRPPVAVIVPAVVSWSVWCAALAGGALTLAASTWAVALPLLLIATGLTLFLTPRFHLLSRRWVVLVPAGLVLHDQFVLGDTLLVQRPALAGVELARAETHANDLTGPASGHAVEVVLREPTTVILAGTRRAPRGPTTNVEAFLIAPTRPGRFLVAAGERRYLAMAPPNT